MMKNDSNISRKQIISLTSDSKIDLPYKSFPIKFSCLHELIEFSNVFNYSQALSTMNTDINEEFYEKCINNTLTEEVKNKCGFTIYNSITKHGLFPNFSYIFTKPDQQIDLSLKDTYEISEFTEIIKNINFDIEIDKSSIIKESQVSNKEIDRYDELLRSIITIGSIDINFSSRSNSLIISYILFIFIVLMIC